MNSTIIPNPATTSIRVTLPDSDIARTVMIFNQLGKNIYQVQGSGEIIIDTQDFASGIYNCVVITGGIPSFERVVIVR